MGMFSYICKGCGQELIEGEFCRLNGCLGHYDGYGRCGGFEGDEPIAWHEKCYQESPLKDDQAPSTHAPNQGFGPQHLEFMENYDPNAETTFEVQIETWSEAKKEDGQISVNEYELILTPTGLQDQKEWDRNYRQLGDDIEDGKQPRIFEEEDDDWWINATDEEKEEYNRQYEVEIEKRIGPNPSDNAIQFASFAEAKEALENALKRPVGSGWALKPFDQYHANIFGTQESATGMVYGFSRTQDYDWENNKRLDTYAEKEEYNWENRIPHLEKKFVAKFHLLLVQESVTAAQKQLHQALKETDWEVGEDLELNSHLQQLVEVRSGITNMLQIIGENDDRQ
jgi:hypothetical protein